MITYCAAVHNDTHFLNYTEIQYTVFDFKWFWLCQLFLFVTVTQSNRKRDSRQTLSSCLFESNATVPPTGHYNFFNSMQRCTFPSRFQMCVSVKMFLLLAFYTSIFVCPFIQSGELFLPHEYRPGSDHQAERDTLRWVHSLYESSQSYPHPHPSAGSPVHPIPLHARGAHQPGHLWFLYKHILPLPGTVNSRCHVWVWIQMLLRTCHIDLHSS